MKKLLLGLFAVAFATSVFAVKPSAYSDQQTLLRSGDFVAQADSGEVVVKYFSYTTTALTNASVALVRIPANARIIGGAIQSTDMGGLEVLDLGLIGADGNGYINDTSSTADDIDYFLDGVANPNDSGFDTGGASGGIGEANASSAIFDKDVYLAVSAAAGDPIWVADKVISGWVMYLK
jgi:hypothetical protein